MAVGLGGSVVVEILVASLPLVVLLVAGRLLGRMTPFSWARSMLAVRSFTGENLAVVLATVAIVVLLVDGTTVLGSSLTERELLTIVAGLSLGTVAGLAIFPRLTLAVVAAGGLVAELWMAFVDYGPTLGVLLIGWAVMMLWLLGLIRGFFRPV